MNKLFNILSKEVSYWNRQTSDISRACYLLNIGEAKEILQLKAENEELKKHIEFIETDNAVYATKVDGSWPNEQIVKLKAENELYKSALQRIANRECTCDLGEDCDCAWRIALKAVEPERYAELVEHERHLESEVKK